MSGTAGTGPPPGGNDPKPALSHPSPWGRRCACAAATLALARAPVGCWRSRQRARSRRAAPTRICRSRGLPEPLPLGPVGRRALPHRESCRQGTGTGFGTSGEQHPDPRRSAGPAAEDEAAPLAADVPTAVDTRSPPASVGAYGDLSPGLRPTLPRTCRSTSRACRGPDEGSCRGGHSRGRNHLPGGPVVCPIGRALGEAQWIRLCRCEECSTLYIPRPPTSVNTTLATHFERTRPTFADWVLPACGCGRTRPPRRCASASGRAGNSTR